MLRRSRSAISLCCIFLVAFLQFPLVTSIDIPEDIRHGPFIDRVVYRVILGQDSVLLALQSGEVEIGHIDHSPIWILSSDPDIDVLETPRNAYSYISINCDKYPMNILGFRQAFAFAFNKSKAVDYVYEGHASLHDSVVPSTHRWCAEDLLEYHYYEADIERGNAILDELGFTLNATSGYRDAPNGEPFTVIGIYPEYIEPARIAQLAREALDSLHISSFWDTPWYPVPLLSYDMIVSSWSGEYDTMVWENSIFNYYNASLSYWIEEYNDGKTYEEVFEASAEIQKILHYNVPRLVVCQPNYLEAIRIDQFQGHVEDYHRYFSGPWTLRRIHRVDGTYGGTFNLAISRYLFTFNIYIYSHMIFENLYSSLFSHGPNLEPIPDLAESMLVETHSDNPSISQGHTRFTFDILQNATWSDGMALTAEDISFTFLYQIESGFYGNPAVSSLTDLVGVYSPSTYRVVFEFSSESYWHFDKIAYDYIIPKHIFTTIGYEGWNTWNPVLDPAEPHVTCGPFLLTDFDAGEFIELTVNPDYHWLPMRPPQPPNHGTSTTPIMEIPKTVFVTFTVYSLVIVVAVMILIGERKHPD